MNELITNLKEYFQHYSTRQKVLIIAVLIGIISSTITLILWANRPEYELLYSNLNPESASAVIDDLRSNNIKYKIENGGKSIYIPREYISEMRLKFAQSGYIKDGVSGYEIFEKSNMGMTTFMQKVNMRRALEGELTRTINQFPEVRQCRVHLVIPESRLFEEQKKGSASVVLNLNPGTSLKKNQVDGIASLVASSIEGLDSKDVVVLDTNGNILGDIAKDAETMGSVGNQWELQNAIESEMQTKVQEIVEGVVGLNNSVVKVSVDMNFDQIERTTEEIDPENVVIVSENIMSESSFNVDDSSNFKSESTTSNYELSKKMERFVSSTGTIERITVAVLLNGKYQVSEGEDGKKTTAYIPRDNDELNRISALVKSAVGYSEERGDIVEVQNLQFDNSTNLADEEYFQELIKKEMWEKYITYGLLALAIILGFILVRMLFKSSITKLLTPALEGIPALSSGIDQVAGKLPEGQKSKTAPLPEPEEEISEDLFIKKLSPEARAKLKAKDKMTAEVIEFTKQSPEDASKLIRSWLTQDKRIKT